MSLTESGDPKHLVARHWVVCLLAQAYEFWESVEAGDMAHAEEEMADAAAVAFDCIRLLYGHDAFFVLNKRMVKNMQKQVGGRTNEFYEDKLRHLRERLGVIE